MLRKLVQHFGHTKSISKNKQLELVEINVCYQWRTFSVVLEGV